MTDKTDETTAQPNFGPYGPGPFRLYGAGPYAPAGWGPPNWEPGWGPGFVPPSPAAGASGDDAKAPQPAWGHPPGFGPGWGPGFGHHHGAWGPGWGAGCGPNWAAPPASAKEESASLFSSGLGVHNDALIKGLLIGAGLTFLLTNESVQKNLIGAAVKVWSTLQGGVEEMKERFRDAEAELAADEDEVR